MKPPQLIVQIVIDQLRGDMLNLHRNKFSDQGFNYLFKHGINYSNTHHAHANTTTCPGHASIATGSYPSFHGIVNNRWYDVKNKRTEYCMADKSSPILSNNPKHKAMEGRSPINLMASTVSDEIILAKKGKSFAVSLKDRAAISLAGHAGKAFWFDKSNGGFISSTWYYKSYPKWVSAWNKNYNPETIQWSLSQPKTNYLYANAPSFDNLYPEFNRHFPHTTGHPASANYYKFLSMTPKADALVLDFTKRLLLEEHLGQGKDQTDYLAVSFSAVDAIGHQFGPNSLEAEDNLLQLDQTLADFFKALDEQVGLKNVLIVLTADHGVSDSPAYLKNHQLKTSTSLDPEQLEIDIRQALNRTFNLPEAALTRVQMPYIYLNKKILGQYKVPLAEVQSYLANQLNRYSDVYKLYPLPLRTPHKDWLSTTVNRMTYKNRSGDLYLVAKPNLVISRKSKQRVYHGSPWQYDSFVPLLIANPLFHAKTVYRATKVTDIASTLTAILMIKKPSASVGQPLKEILAYYH